MNYDIYGNTLRAGHCEVHPDISQPYPCPVCIVQDAQNNARHEGICPTCGKPDGVA